MVDETVRRSNRDYRDPLSFERGVFSAPRTRIRLINHHQFCKKMTHKCHGDDGLIPPNPPVPLEFDLTVLSHREFGRGWSLASAAPRASVPRSVRGRRRWGHRRKNASRSIQEQAHQPPPEVQRDFSQNNNMEI